MPAKEGCEQQNRGSPRSHEPATNKAGRRIVTERSIVRICNMGTKQELTVAMFPHNSYRELEKGAALYNLLIGQPEGKIVTVEAPYPRNVITRWKVVEITEERGSRA